MGNQIKANKFNIKISMKFENKVAAKQNQT